MRRIGLANALTLSRFGLSPVFALFFGLAARAGSPLLVTILWVTLLVIEGTDILDGVIARRSDTVSDVGKILDPFADVVSKVTYFACLLAVGVVPLWFLLLVLYREFGIILIRMMLYRDGTALAAGMAGKIKTWLYAITAGWGLLEFSSAILAVELPRWSAPVMIVLLIGTSALSLFSFGQYLAGFLQLRRNEQ